MRTVTKAYLTAHHYTIASMARALGINEQHLQRGLNGKRALSPELNQRMLALMDADRAPRTLAVIVNVDTGRVTIEHGGELTQQDAATAEVRAHDWLDARLVQRWHEQGLSEAEVRAMQWRGL